MKNPCSARDSARRLGSPSEGENVLLGIKTVPRRAVSGEGEGNCTSGQLTDRFRAVVMKRRQRAPLPENDGVPTPTTKPDRLLTVEEVAEITGLSVETLNQWRSQRRGIPFVRLSRNRVRYRQSDLDAFIEENIIHTIPVHSSPGRR